MQRLYSSLKWMGFLEDFGSFNLSYEISVTAKSFDFDGWHVFVTSFEVFPKCFLVILAFAEILYVLCVFVCVCVILPWDYIG